MPSCSSCKSMEDARQTYDDSEWQITDGKFKSFNVKVVLLIVQIDAVGLRDTRRFEEID